MANRKNDFTLKEKKQMQTPHTIKSAKFLPDIPVYRATVNQNSDTLPMKRNEQQAQSNIFRQTVQNAPSSHSSSPASGKIPNMDYKNVRTFGNLYDQSLNGKIRETIEKYRLGPRKVPCSYAKLPPLKQQQLWSYQNTIGGGQIVKSQHFEEGSLPVKGKADQLNDSEFISNDQIHRYTAFDSMMTKTDSQLFLRPVMKKNILHYQYNVIVVFKSVEVNALDQNPDQRNKWFSPLYLPVHNLDKIIGGTKKQIELLILQKLNYDKEKGFSLKEKLHKDLSISIETQETTLRKKGGQQIEDPLPEVIRTSFLVTQGTQQDFQFSIRMPSIEYHIPSLNFTFIKYLSRQELTELNEQSFYQWDELTVKFFMQYRKFVETLRQVKLGEKEVKNGLEESKEGGGPMNLFVLTEQNGVKVKKYTSFSALKSERQQKQKSKLLGCFQKEGGVGKLELTSFILRMKSMNGGLWQREEKVPLEHWKQVIQFMKYQALKNYEEAKSILDKIGQAFQSFSKQTQSIQSFFQILNLGKYCEKKMPKGVMNSARRKASQNFFQFQKVSQVVNIGDERYLCELEFPLIRLSFKEQEIQKKLNEEDCLYLIDSDFKEWKHYLIHQHFRMELNVPSHEPLPRIQEVKRGEEEDYVTEGDANERYPVVNDEEKRSIERTREKLSHWFPY